jgi:hypothetical protein
VSTLKAWAAAAALVTLQAALLLGIARDKSDTVDEPFYLENALSQWGGDLEGNCDSPALPKWGFGLALRLSDAELFRPGTGHQPIFSRPFLQGRRNLLAARLTTIVVVSLSGLALFLAVLPCGAVPALLTQALYVLSPSILAHGSLATLDGWATAFAALAILAGQRLFTNPTKTRFALFGLVAGLGSACKVTLLALLPILWTLLLLGWLLGRLLQRPLKLVLGAALSALAFGLALFVVYGFTFGTIHTANLCGHATQMYGDHAIGPLPAPAFFEGILFQGVHGSTGHLTYLFGRSSETGWWWFYLAALALKTTLGAQLLFVLTLLALFGRGADPEARLRALSLLLFPAILILVMSLGHAQNGLKYILPAFPFGIAFLGLGLPRIPRAFPRAGGVLVLLGVLGGGLESLLVYPNDLMFFNVWAGGPAGGPRYLVHGDDWGQDQSRLGAWQAEHHPWRLYYTRYNGDPLFWGIRAEEPPCAPSPGYYALHAVEVHRPKRLVEGCLDWLTVEPPDSTLGASIYLYQVNRERIARLEAERGHLTPFWKSGQ